MTVGRWAVAAAGFLVVFALLAWATATVVVSDTGIAVTGAPWMIVALVLVAALEGAIFASYRGAPIGAEATLCDTRWPVLGMMGIYAATELRSSAPMFSEEVRPIIAVAAFALLVWALWDRVRRERGALAARKQRDARAASLNGDLGPLDSDGESCSTCRPLFPTRVRRTGA